ncbi:hypothetical protein HF086_014131 [Spodoptera exigua]|uniref:Ionotropic receptor n=1 Tax=Spodoptera exigua TaxID=7107 RepID=A0A922MM65_SPOEX|nr:hypothetical protein HF086_014131 [Spodoptera exigua]
MDVFILCLVCVFVNRNTLIKAERNDVTMLTSCIVKLLEQVDYKAYDKVMDITLMNMNNDLQLSALHQVLGARFISRRFFWDTENISNVIYIVMSDDYQELADGLNKVTSDKFWNPSARFIIVVQNTKEYSLHDLTHLLHTYNIFHKVSVISRNGDVYAIYRYNFTKPGNCFRAGHLIFWSWCSDFISGKKLAFLTNGSIRNCRFEFIAQNLWPFMNFDNDVKGSEQYFLAIFQKQYRVQIVLKEFTKFNKYGKPVDNIRKIIHEKVVHNEYEGAVGGFSINSAYSVMCKDYQELADGLYKVSSDRFWNPSARFIIIVMNMEENSLQNFTNILHRYNIFKVSVISRNGNEYAIYKYNVTKPGTCLTDGLLTFWSWCTDYCSGKLLPPLNPGSIRGCRYKFYAHNVWPFTNFDTKVKGTEQYLLTLFDKHYGTKIEIVEYNKVDKYGNPVSNVSEIILKKVAHNKIEGALGGYSVQSAWGGVSYGYPYKIDHVFYVLAHSTFIDPWLAMFRQCLWIYFGAAVVFVCFCILARFLAMFRTPEDVSRNALIVFGYMLNKYVLKRTPSGWTTALVFTVLMFTSFIIPYTIQTKLYSLTTRPVRRFEPKVASDLKNYQAILPVDWVGRYRFAGHRVCGTRLTCLQALAKRKGTLQYTMASKSYYLIYRWKVTDEHCNFVTYNLKEPYSTVLRTIYLRRGSVLLESFNRLVLNVADTGILKKYDQDMSSRERVRCRSHPDEIFMPVSLEKLHFAFIVLIVGCFLSFILFMCEVCVG